MTGPEHYAEGERLLAEAAQRDDRTQVELDTARAHAHFKAAEVALLAKLHEPKSIAWNHAIQPQEDRT